MTSDMVREILVRDALRRDLDFVVGLEEACFAAHRRSTRRSYANSIQSAKQKVCIAEIIQADGERVPVGVAVAFLHKRSLRIYSIAVSSQYRLMGVGEALMRFLIDLSENLHFEKTTLEADAQNARLIGWYRKFGFEVTRFLEDYYMRGESAYRMTRKGVDIVEPEGRIVLVVDDEKIGTGLSRVTNLRVVTAKDYLSETRYSCSNQYAVLNFCNSYKTHSMGYYVSLLASARMHRIIPSVMTVKDSANQFIAQSLLDEIREYVQERLRRTGTKSFELTIIMGRTDQPQYSGLSKKLFSLFELPFFTLSLEKKNGWQVRRISVLNIQHVLEHRADLLKVALSDYQNKKRYNRTKLRQYKYDLAILINETEGTPPSCSLALGKFSKAARKVGFFVEFITKSDKRRICEFDALFIRETTALDNHTYSIARHAYTEGLVVIDDPWSILLCSNKVYLHERLANAGIRQPNGWLLTRRTCTKAFIRTLVFPLVLKLPESSFSMGVFRVEGPQDFEEKTKVMFAKSDLIIAQEFVRSAYDWRIGILDNQPLFACKYYMADGHWQIYNWQEKETHAFSGQHETIPVNQVPAHVLRAAVKASSLIGNGLYGVDVKEQGQKACVIEVNDNPNIDAGVEDALLGDELYRRIMHSIYNRIEAERNQVRYLC